MKLSVDFYIRVLSIQVLLVLALAGNVHGGQTLNVDMNRGTTYSGTAAAPDSGTKWNAISALGTLNAGSVLDSQGNILPGVSITFSSADGNVHIYNDSNAGNPDPLNLMSDYTYSDTYTFTLKGLVAGQKYELYAYSHGNVDNQTGTITLAAANGGAAASTSQTGNTGNFRNIYTYGAGFNYVKLDGIADASGTFAFTVANYLNGFQLQLLSAPVISGLTNRTVVAGTTIALAPVITGLPDPSFQWWSNNVPMVDATNASLVLNNVQYDQNGVTYSLVASNYVAAVTNKMTLSVIVTPMITGLNNQAVPIGSTVTMTSTVSGVPTPRLQWFLNGNKLVNGSTGNGSTVSGCTTSALSIAAAQAADSGVYSLVARNSAGTTTNSMTLTVSSGAVAPNITGPQNQTVVQSSNAIFNASVSGLPLPTLQWRVNGVAIPSATNSFLTVTNVQYSQNCDVYSMVASNSAGKATNSATLSVMVPPKITQQPSNAVVTIGSSATFAVAASGVPGVSYQWQRNGTPIPGATEATYTIPSAQGADNGVGFSVVVSNKLGNVTSRDATLTVLSTMRARFLPTNGMANIAPDQQLRIVFSSPPKLGSGKLYVHNAADNSVFATIDTIQFQTYRTDSATVSNAFVRTEQGQKFFYMPIAIYGNQAWITLNPTNRFVYGKTYYVTSDTGLFLDKSGAAFPGINGTNTWRFSIQSSGPAAPTASTGPTNITVGLDGTGDFATLQGASDWIPQNNTLPRTITILPGIYHDFAIFTQNRNHVTVVGAGANWHDVQIIYPNAAYTSGSSCGLLRVESSDMYFRNLTLDNQVYLTNSLDNYGPWAGRLNTLDTTGQRLIFDHVMIKGGQDTLYTISGSTYFNHCEIWGSTDFIYGSAVSVFDHCNIVEIRNTGGPCTAPHTDYAQPYGLVFLNCDFPQALVANGYPYDVASGSTTFMRPWGQDGDTAVINCSVGPQISTKGWSEWSGKETTCRAREYGTTLIGGGPVTPAQRQAAGAYWLNTIDPDYTNNPSLSPTDPLLYGSPGTNNRVAVTVDPAHYTLSGIFGNPYFNLHGWMPTVIPSISAQPANQAVGSGTKATFSVLATGLPDPTYQWLKAGTNLVGETNSTLAIPSVQKNDVGTYSVIVSNSAGSVTSSNAALTLAYTSPPLPAIPNATNNVVYFGAVGNGVATNTSAIQDAINALSASPAHGGTVEIPPGVYLSGPIFLANNINLQIDAGATLKMLPYGSYPGGTSPDDFINAVNLHDIEISGNGTIDGQGATWWTAYRNNGISRPKAMFAPEACNRILVRDVTMQNPPNTHISFRDHNGVVCGNVTVSNLTINTPNGTPNTDGMDMSVTNALVEDSYISDGDDNIAMGSGHAGVLCGDITVVHCRFGTGHGVSIGSYTTGGLNHLLVTDCTWNGTANGIRIKSERGRGGLVQNLVYQNLGMTNVQWPILLYSYYNYGVGTLSQATPYMAATDVVQTVTSTTPIWRNITFSNVTATAAGGYPAAMIWGLPEMPVSNVNLTDVHLSGATKPFEIYNASGIKIVDSEISNSSGTDYQLYNADVTITNSTRVTTPIKLDGLTTNGIGNTLAFYNADALLQNTNVLGEGSLTLGGSAFTVDNNLTVSPALDLHLAMGTNQPSLAVSGNLALGGVLNVTDGGGLANGYYTVLTYGGALSGTGPTLGSMPAGFRFSLDTNTDGQVKLLVAPPTSLSPTNLLINLVGTTLTVNWPSDHIGWWLQMQTNVLNQGLGTNWITMPNSDVTDRMSIPINQSNSDVFLRLFHP